MARARVLVLLLVACTGLLLGAEAAQVGDKASLRAEVSRHVTGAMEPVTPSPQFDLGACGCHAPNLCGGCGGNNCC
jgi:hypothetical protein